jgi:hypothetical protein
VADWIRAWRACTSATSFRAAEANGITENFLQRSRLVGVKRKAFSDMVRIMAYAILARRRTLLLEARFVGIGLDDRKEYRIVRFTCDTPQGVRKFGCLGVLRRGGEFSTRGLEHCDDDYSRRMASSVVQCIREIATNRLTKTVDEDVVRAICRKVVCGVADGGSSAQKCLKFLATDYMPNLLWCGRDRAHAARRRNCSRALRHYVSNDFHRAQRPRSMGV